MCLCYILLPPNPFLSAGAPDLRLKRVPTLCRFRQILKKIVDTKQSMGKTMRESAFALTEAKYAAGEFRHTVFDSVETVGLLDAACDGLPWMTCQTL